MTQLRQFVFPEIEDRPLRKVARRLRWFLEAFSSQTKEISSDTGVEFEIDRSQLRAVFMNWVKIFEAQKPTDPHEKSNYITFSAATMLMALIKGQPLRVVQMPENTNMQDPVYFWPEGYTYAAFCMNVRSAILLQEMDLKSEVAPEFDDIRVWWSFKENVGEDSASAISFFELFVGDTPNWSAPELFSARHAEENTLQMVKRNRDQLADGR